MKTFLTTTCLVAIMLLLAACGSESKNSQTEKEPSTHETATHAITTQENGLALNNGQKWQMDGHTRQIFTKMAASFAHVDLAGLNSDNLKTVGAELKTDINELIQGCTMTGPDHDQLHIYLTAYIPAVTALEEKGEVDDAKRVQHYLTIYGDYFE